MFTVVDHTGTPTEVTPMPLTVFSTWTTYGTWLQGDERGWFKRSRGLQSADALRTLEATLRMTDDAATLDGVQRSIVEATIAAHCVFRGWTLHAVNCRSNHVHVVVTAPDRAREVPREQFKAWCSRKLSEAAFTRANWWSERGWDVYLDDEGALAVVSDYVRERQ